MIIAFSTSSPQASVALIAPHGPVLAARSKFAPMQASAACLEMLREMLDELGTDLDKATVFAADLGPGSFTGVKVAVTLAKTFAFSRGVLATGASSFDLISTSATVVFPSKKGEWFVRWPGQEPVRQIELPDEPVVGYGSGLEDQRYPDAGGFVHLLESLEPNDPKMLLPNYIVEPSISHPKNPLSPLGTGNA